MVQLSKLPKPTSSTPYLISSAAIECKKSTFVGHASRLQQASEFSKIKEILLQDKKVSKATHNIWAYRITNDNGGIIQDCDDDGETAAGSRLLHLLEMLKVTNVVVFVSRWYGGVHLGADRFKYINMAARDVLELGQFLPVPENNKDGKSSSKGKKGKKK